MPESSAHYVAATMSQSAVQGCGLPSNIRGTDLLRSTRDGVGDPAHLGAGGGRNLSEVLQLGAALEIPASPPRALTRSSTPRVETPCASASLGTRCASSCVSRCARRVRRAHRAVASALMRSCRVRWARTLINSITSAVCSDSIRRTRRGCARPPRGQGLCRDRCYTTRWNIRWSPSHTSSKAVHGDARIPNRALSSASVPDTANRIGSPSLDCCY